MSPKRKRRGHYCWVCDCQRPNEAFTGKGHARHICKDCWKLGQPELEFLQVLDQLENCCTDEGIVRRKQRRHFQRLLNHEFSMIRVIAQGVLLDQEFEQWIQIELDNRPVPRELRKFQRISDESWAMTEVHPVYLEYLGYPDLEEIFPQFAEPECSDEQFPDEMHENLSPDATPPALVQRTFQFPEFD